MSSPCRFLVFSLHGYHPVIDFQLFMSLEKLLDLSQDNSHQPVPCFHTSPCNMWRNQKQLTVLNDEEIKHLIDEF